MQSLLSSARRPDAPNRADGDSRESNALPGRSPLPLAGTAPPFRIAEGPQRTLADLQRELRHHGIAAEPREIAEALLDSLSARPALCRGLMAAYLLGE